jgi:hypothetical protein
MSTFWDWLKRFRVWKAVRIVFQYPENWLQPEHRKDKSSSGLAPDDVKHSPPDQSRGRDESDGGHEQRPR